MEEQEFEDISSTPVDRINNSWFMQQENWIRFYYGYSLEQVQRIVELVYLPHQIDQWNKKIRGQDGIPVGTLSKEDKEVTLEEILPTAFEHIKQLYEFYTSIPQGYYYGRGDGHPDSCPESLWNIKRLRDLMGLGSPSDFVSKKRFNGFVVKEVNFTFSLSGSHFELPDRRLFFHWDLHDPRYACICPCLKSRFDSGARIINQQEFKDLIFSRFELWQRKFKELKGNPDLSGEFNGPYAQQGEEDFQRNFLPRFIGARFIDRLDISSDRSDARKYGHWLKTREVNGPQEAYNFAERFFDNLDPGKSFNEYFD